MTEQSINKTVGSNLAKYRKAKGLTQIQLAKKLNILQTTLSSYEVGRRALPVAMIVGITEILEITIEELLGKQLKTKRSPSPTSRLEKQLADVKHLSRLEQQYVSKFLDQVLAEKKTAEK